MFLSCPVFVFSLFLMFLVIFVFFLLLLFLLPLALLFLSYRVCLFVEFDITGVFVSFFSCPRPGAGDGCHQHVGFDGASAAEAVGQTLCFCAPHPEGQAGAAQGPHEHAHGASVASTLTHAVGVR